MPYPTPQHDEEKEPLTLANVIGYFLVGVLCWAASSYLNLKMIAPARNDLARSERRYNRLFEETQSMRLANEALAEEIESFSTNEMAIRADLRRLFRFEEPGDVVIEFQVQERD